MGHTLSVSVVVSTRNPDERILQSLTSILASDYARFNLCVVDQSDGDGTRALLAPVLQDARATYIRCEQRGLSVGRNAGARWAEQADVLAFTDDDCAVTADWLAEMTAPFLRDARIGVVFGTVKPAPYDPALGFLPSYARNTPFLARSIFDKHQIEGMGASMAIRQSVWKGLHGFDEMLGAGAPMRSAEETDFVIRALLGGFAAFETTGGAVIHSGFRTWAQAPRTLHDYSHGIGAALVKNARLGHWSIAAVAARLATRWVFARPVINMGAQSHRRARLLGFLTGAWAGLSTPIDRATGHFVSAPAVAAMDVEIPHPWQSLAAARIAIDPVIADRSPGELDPPTEPPTADRVSIVLPNWNALPFLERALASLVRHTTYPYELIVVDNGSTDGSKDYIRRFLCDHPQLDSTFIENAENLYFSTACNQGFRAASPDTKYLALYCNDVEATDDKWLQELVDAIQPDDTVAAGHTGIEAITDRQRGVFSIYDPLYNEAGVKERMADLLGRPGANYTHLYGYCFLLKRSLLHRTGLYLYNGPFRQYHSDWEWSLRFAAMNYRIASVPIKVHHWHSISELLAFHPELYRDLLQRLENPATVERYLQQGRPLYETESGFRNRYATPVARILERLKRRVR